MWDVFTQFLCVCVLLCADWESASIATREEAIAKTYVVLAVLK